jgi:hypothetical protein
MLLEITNKGIKFLENIGSGAHPASYPVGTRGFFPEDKAAGESKLTIHLHLEPR